MSERLDEAPEPRKEWQMRMTDRAGHARGAGWKAAKCTGSEGIHAR